MDTEESLIDWDSPEPVLTLVPTYEPLPLIIPSAWMDVLVPSEVLPPPLVPSNFQSVSSPSTKSVSSPSTKSVSSPSTKSLSSLMVPPSLLLPPSLPISSSSTAPTPLAPLSPSAPPSMAPLDCSDQPWTSQSPASPWCGDPLDLLWAPEHVVSPRPVDQSCGAFTQWTSRPLAAPHPSTHLAPSSSFFPPALPQYSIRSTSAA